MQSAFRTPRPGPGRRPTPAVAPAPAPAPALAPSKLAFRVQGIPLMAKLHDLRLAFPDIDANAKIEGSICVSCKDDDLQVAIIKFTKFIPVCLAAVISGKKASYQCEMHYDGATHALNVDKNFHGLTQLYNTPKGTRITAE